MSARRTTSETFKKIALALYNLAIRYEAIKRHQKAGIRQFEIY
jgi:hypothetical protein